MPRSMLSLLIYTAYGLFAVAIFLFAWSSTSETTRLNHEVRRIQKEIAQLKTDCETRRDTSEALTSDPFYIERVLRERYGYSRPDEERLDTLDQITRPPQPQRPGQPPVRSPQATTRSQRTPPPPPRTTHNTNTRLTTHRSPR